MSNIKLLEADLKAIVRNHLDYLAEHDDDEVTRQRLHRLMWLTAYLPNVDEAQLVSDENIQRAVEIDY